MRPRGRVLGSLGIGKVRMVEINARTKRVFGEEASCARGVGWGFAHEFEAFGQKISGDVALLVRCASPVLLVKGLK